VQASATVGRFVLSAVTEIPLRRGEAQSSSPMARRGDAGRQKKEQWLREEGEKKLASGSRLFVYRTRLPFWFGFIGGAGRPATDARIIAEHKSVRRPG